MARLLRFFLLLGCCCFSNTARDLRAADPELSLHRAVHLEDVAATTALLAAGADANQKNEYGVAPLFLACENGNPALVDALLAAGADANATLPGGETVLMTASRTGVEAPVSALLSAGAKVEASDRKRQTALMWAAAEGHAAVCRLLIAAGADPDRALPSGFTPFFFAVREGQREVVRLMLEPKTRDVNRAMEVERKAGRGPERGTSALRLAVENGHFDLANDLLEAGADPNDQRSGFAPLHVLTWVRKPNRGDGDDGQPPPIGSGRMSSLEFAEALIKKGANVNLQLTGNSGGGNRRRSQGATPFFMAAKTADLPYLKLLHQRGADPFLPDHDGATPLMVAAGLGTFAPTEEAGTEPECLQVVAWLRSLGAEVNTVDNDGETAMHGAAYASFPEMVRYLAEQGADIARWNQKNKRGWTPLLIAQGFRPGNFKPAPEVIAAIGEVMQAAGVTPPPAPARPVVGEKKKYEP